MEQNQKPSGSNKKTNPTGKIALIILIAIFIVAGVSCLPLQKWTGGRIKDFNLLGDILPLSEDSSFIQQGADIVDPELLRIRQQSESEAAVNQQADLYGMDQEPEGGWTPSDTVRPYVDPDTIVQQPKQNRVGTVTRVFSSAGRFSPTARILSSKSTSAWIRLPPEITEALRISRFCVILSPSFLLYSFCSVPLLSGCFPFHRFPPETAGSQRHA